MSKTHLKVKYKKQEKEFDYIDNYDKFLEKCSKEFQLNKQEIKNLKLYQIDEEGDELIIENENDYQNNLEPNDNVEITYNLKLIENKKSLEKIEEEKSSELSTLKQKTETNSHYRNENNGGIYSDELSKLKEEMVNEFKSITKEIEMDLKKVLKRNINDIKSYLIGLGDQILNISNDLKILNQNLFEPKSNNNKVNSFQNNLSLEKQINSLSNKIEKMYKKLNSYGNNNSKNNDVSENCVSKECEDNNSEKFYGCKFEEKNFDFNYTYDNLIKSKKITFGITLMNNGNLSWPKNSMIYGRTKDNQFEVKSIINSNNEVLPNQQINPIISLTYKNIKNENKTYSFPLKLVFQNQSKIKQNECMMELTIKESKQKYDYSVLDTPKPNQSDNEVSSNNSNDSSSN